MAVFKCKMCGGDLNIDNGITVAECEYCGTRQTVSKSGDEIITNLFTRANNLRLKCEFDKAEQVYEKILDIDNTDSEAHWGIVLCKYGIEYVEDPKTYKRIPTCHRTLYEAIRSDINYTSAIENADESQKQLYIQEAVVIDGLQKDILNIVNNEKPFDVFLCYKESDGNGNRTPDSVIANDIYHQLTQEGFKVFYAAITLEDKLGQEYEPYIFAALNSAKVMLVVGTKPQYFDAVWVRNEWSRFLKLTKNDHQKLLIPCYRDMDAYELPQEFAHLQAQNMSKIGFINDVVRGIKKVAASDVTMFNNDIRYEVKNQSLSNDKMTALLNRGFMELEEGHFKKAKNFFEQVLDYDAKFAMAYVGKLMVNLRVKKQENLGNYYKSFENNKNFQKAMRFADEELTKTLQGYLSSTNERAKNLSVKKIFIIIIDFLTILINAYNIFLFFGVENTHGCYYRNWAHTIVRASPDPRNKYYYNLNWALFWDISVVVVITIFCMAVAYLISSFLPYKYLVKKFKNLYQFLFSLVLIISYVSFYFLSTAHMPSSYLTNMGWSAVVTLCLAIVLTTIQYFLAKSIKYKENK